MNASDKLYIIGELETRTGYQFEHLRTMSDEKLEEMYWERVMNGKKPDVKPKGKKRGKR